MTSATTASPCQARRIAAKEPLHETLGLREEPYPDYFFCYLSVKLRGLTPVYGLYLARHGEKRLRAADKNEKGLYFYRPSIILVVMGGLEPPTPGL